MICCDIPDFTGGPITRVRGFTHGAISAHRAELHGAQVWTTTIPTITARGHVPHDQAALECAFLAVMTLDPTCQGPARWTHHWKAARNAFAITFDGRFPAGHR